MATASLTTIALIVHIIIALGSVGWAIMTMVAPSRHKLTISYGGIIATVASGTYLVLATGAPMLRSCLTGLFFVLAVCMMNVVARRRLVGQEA
jgi:hypothetical protein